MACGFSEASGACDACNHTLWSWGYYPHDVHDTTCDSCNNLVGICSKANVG